MSPASLEGRKRRQLLRILARALSSDKQIDFAYVYGSFLRRKDARDIDVAVHLKGAAEPWLRAQRIGGSLEKALSYRFRMDVHALNTASASFAFRVLEEGKVLLERDREKRRDWEAHALSAYQDIKPMLDFHDRRFLSS